MGACFLIPLHRRESFPAFMKYKSFLPIWMGHIQARACPWTSKAWLSSAITGKEEGAGSDHNWLKVTNPCPQAWGSHVPRSPGLLGEWPLDRQHLLKQHLLGSLKHVGYRSGSAWPSSWSSWRWWWAWMSFTVPSTQPWEAVGLTSGTQMGSPCLPGEKDQDVSCRFTGSLHLHSILVLTVFLNLPEIFGVLIKIPLQTHFDCDDTSGKKMRVGYLMAVTISPFLFY